MNVERIVFCFLAALLFFASFGSALEVKGGERFVLEEGEVISDDVIAVGGEIVIDGKIDGDLIAAGGEITVSGKVTGDVIAAGGVVSIDGDVLDDAIVAGGNVEVYGDVSDNLLAAGGSFRMGDESTVGRDAFLAAGMADVYGDVSRNLDVSGGSVVIGGSVVGDVSIEADEAPRIASGARIAGDINYTCLDDIIIEEGSSVLGSVSKKLPEVSKRTDFEKFNEMLIGFLSIFLVGFILVRLFPFYTRNVCNNLRKSALMSGFWGIAGLIAVPIVALLLMVTVVGLPIALILVVMYIIVIYISKVYLSVFVGKFLLNLAGSKSDSLVLMLVLGLLIFELIGLVPAVSGFVGLLVVVFGFGALLLTDKQMYHDFRKKKAI